MNKKFSAKEVLIPTVSLFIIALVATLLLSVVNGLTAGKIAEANAAAEAAARQTVFPEAKKFEDKKDYYIAEDGEGKPLGYVFMKSSKGYGGDVSVTVGIDNEGSVTGIVPGDLSQETPGLGQTADKPEFLKQFVGKNSTITVVKSQPGDNEIQALTSATITSKAVTNAVNEALAQYKTITGGGK